MAKPNFWQREKSAYVNGAVFGSTLGLTAGILTVMLAPGLVGGATLGGVLMATVMGWFLGGIAGALLLGGKQTVTDAGNTIVHPLSNNSEAVEHSLAKKRAHSRHRKMKHSAEMEAIADHPAASRTKSFSEQYFAERERAHEPTMPHF